MNPALRDLILGTTGDAPTPPFSPIDIAGLQLWLDASDASTITLDGSDNVEQWNDKSGNARHATQASALLRPALSTVNSLAAVQFDAVDDAMNGETIFAADSNFSMFVVGRMDALGTERVAYFLTGTDKGFGTSFSAGATPFNRPGYLNGTIAWRPATTVQLSNGAVLLQQLKRSGTSNTYIHYPGAVTVTNTDSPASYPHDVYRLGWQGGAGVGRQATTICEVVLYNSNLSAGDTTSVQNYLAAKWGITLS